MLVLLAACGTTGGNVVSFGVVAQGAEGAAVFETPLGWHVALKRATLHVGAVYLNLAVPISGSQGTNCILPGIYTAEELYPLDVDVLSRDRQPFPQPATGTDDTARTGEIWLTGGDVNADGDSTLIADIQGTASNALLAKTFSARVTINAANRGIPASNPAEPSSNPICKQRIVSPIPIMLQPHDGGTLVITVDSERWFDNVDFAALPDDGVIPDDNSSSVSQNLFSGLRAATTSFQLTFE